MLNNPERSIEIFARTTAATVAAFGAMTLNAARAEAADPDDCKAPELKWEVVIQQVPFFDLERYELGAGTGRQGIFDKGVKAPMDPYIEKPALGGMAMAKSLDGTKEYDTDRISQTAPKIDPKIKTLNLKQNVGWAHLKWCAVPNDKAVHPITGKTIPTLALKLFSTQDIENDTYPTVIPSGAVADHWFGREVGKEVVDSKVVMDYVKVMEILDDRNQPLKDLPTETRAKLRETLSKKIQDERTAEAQRLEAEKGARTQKPADNQESNDFVERVKALGANVWEEIKKNPVPVAIIAVLMAALLLARNDRHFHVRGRRVF